MGFITYENSNASGKSALSCSLIRSFTVCVCAGSPEALPFDICGWRVGVSMCGRMGVGENAFIS